MTTTFDSQRRATCPAPLQVTQPVANIALHRWLYCSDAHTPVHDPIAIDRLVSVGRRLGVDDLVIGGDWFDFAELSSHGDDIEMPDINKAIEVSGQVLRYVKSNFQNIYILPGNHCRRAAKLMNKNLSFKNLVRMAVGDLTGFHITDHDYFLVNPSTPENPGWTVGHPRFFAQFPTKGLEQVAMMRQRHVIGAHSHTWGLTKFGKFLCVSPGHMMRPDLTPYLVRSNGLSKHPDQEPSSGFVLIETILGEGDIVTMFGDGVTRWSDYR